ncbi:MAG: DUF4347 domain-containing protein [Betaproteobacteria bacterium]|nr:DUF4347 domain-containing protein [Betaproteobacteria bacterium]
MAAVAPSTRAPLTLKSTNLNDHADTLAQIGSALTQDGDWLMYGCNVAAGAAGVDLIGQLVQASGADVAASTDLTGAATAGGDWVLEYAAGSIDAAAMPVSQYDQLLVDASFNFDSGVSGNTTATMTMTVSGETLNIVITQDNLYLTSYAGESPINGSDSVLTGNNNATKITFSLAGGKQFGLSSLKIREVFGASESLTLRTNNGSTAAYSLTPYEAYTWDVSGNPNMQGITSVELTGTSAFLLVIDDVSLSSIQNTAPSVTTPTAITLTDTSTADTFTNQTGTLSATDSDGIASYGISSPTSTNANFSDGGITYDIRKIGTYGSLYVKSSDGQYVYVPEANPTNALSTNASETFTVTATDSNASPATGTATLTVNITGVNDSPVAGRNHLYFPAAKSRRRGRHVVSKP